MCVRHIGVFVRVRSYVGGAFLPLGLGREEPAPVVLKYVYTCIVIVRCAWKNTKCN